jgi:lipopolysaccharide export LptBFGC system permease protein LptF
MTYKFESYSDTHMVFGVILGTALCMVGIFGAIFLIDAVPILKSYDDYVIISIIALTLVVLWALAKTYLVQKSKITLKNDLLIFQRKSKKKELKISDIESYKYKLVQGVRLVIWTRYNEKIVIHANDYFCAHEELEVFCSDFDDYVNSLKTPQKVTSEKEYSANHSKIPDLKEAPELLGNASEVITDEESSTNKPERVAVKTSTDFTDKIPKRKKSFYEKKYAQPFLMVFTALVIAFVIYVKMDGGDISGVIIISIGGLAALWAGYFNHQKK